MVLVLFKAREGEGGEEKEREDGGGRKERRGKERGRAQTAFVKMTLNFKNSPRNIFFLLSLCPWRKQNRFADFYEL